MRGRSTKGALPGALLLAAAWLPSAVGVEEAVAVRLTGVIGTANMEGAASDGAGNFYFCNLAAPDYAVSRGNIGVLRPDGSVETWLNLPEGMRGNGLRVGPDGALYLADQLGGRVARIDPEDKMIEVLHDFGFEGLFWNNAPNDLAFSKDGEWLYVSCMTNGVWRMRRDGSEAAKVCAAYANGLDVSPDGRTLILANGFHAIEADGSLRPTGLKPDLPKEGYAYTDGLRCDAEGRIYISRAGAKRADGGGARVPGAVQVFSPEGRWLKNIEAPHPRVHNLGFGGPQGRTLYLICPGDDGFVAVYENRTAGLSTLRLREWGLKEP